VVYQFSINAECLSGCCLWIETEPLAATTSSSDFARSHLIIPEIEHFSRMKISRSIPYVSSDLDIELYGSTQMVQAFAEKGKMISPEDLVPSPTLPKSSTGE
jgi:hypothetical protein